MIPDKYKGDERYIVFLNAMTGFHNTVKLFSDLGFHTIIDQVFEKTHKTLEECVELLHDYPVLFVHVKCPIKELRRREKERGDRHVGLAEKLLSVLVPQDNQYDIVIDTYQDSIDECTNKIIDVLKYPEKFTAFRTLWSEYSIIYNAQSGEIPF